MKILLIVLGGGALLAVAAVAVWVYVVQNVETPAHTVVEAEGPVEIRDYPALIVAEVMRAGARDEGLRAGFRPLARYIFASDREGEKIAMTAPVTQEPEGAEGWAVRFIMPAGKTLADLPEPSAGDVRLREIPAGRRAAIRFSGHARDALMAEKEAELRRWLSARGIEPAGPAVYAYYNDPMTPGFLRRNEVLIPLPADGD